MFLICDPYLAADPIKPDNFVISGLGAVDINSPARVLADGSVDLHFDLTGTPDATYTVSVKASLAGNASAASASLTFTLPVPPPPPPVPAVPLNVRLSNV